MNDKHKDGTAGHEGEPRAKRRYQKPRLIEYGSVAKLTRGTKSITNDAAGGGKKSKACL